jgi:hypothetical protein
MAPIVNILFLLAFADHGKIAGAAAEQAGESEPVLRTRTLTELICAEDRGKFKKGGDTSGGGWEYNHRYGQPKRKFR